jgi:predicted kinase
MTANATGPPSERRRDASGDPEASGDPVHTPAGLTAGGTVHPLVLPRRALVVVAGVPGAGKSTLLQRLRATSAPGSFSIRDPEDIRLRWERVLGGQHGYRVWRPLVYVEHYSRLAVALAGRRPIVLHDTATRTWTRRLLGRTAGLTGRPAVLLWIAVSLDEAMAGQRARGRTVPRRTVRKHWRRWSELRTDTEHEPGFREVWTITRDQARVLTVTVAPAGP